MFLFLIVFSFKWAVKLFMSDQFSVYKIAAIMLCTSSTLIVVGSMSYKGHHALSKKDESMLKWIIPLWLTYHPICSITKVQINRKTKCLFTTKITCTCMSVFIPADLIQYICLYRVHLSLIA